MAVPATMIGFAILILVVIWWVVRSVSRPERKNSTGLPPGPSPLPIIGNLHQLGDLPHRALHEFAKQYGPIMFLRLGSVPTVVVSSSLAAKEFLKTHDLVFANRPASAAGKYLVYNHKDVALAPYGSYWRHMRKICVLELLTAKRIESFKSVREEEASLVIHSIAQKSNGGSVAIDLSNVISSYTSDVIWRTITARKYREKDVSATGIGFKEIVREISDTIGSFCVGDFIPWLRWLDLQGLQRRMKNVHNLFDGLAEKILDEHAQRSKPSLADEQSKELVDVLLDMDTANVHTHTKADMKITRPEMKAIIIDLLSAGLETTSVTLEWAMSELLRDPEMLKKLQEEIETVVGKDRMVTESDLKGMEYLHCVVKETLRLHPAVPLLLPHEATEACTVKGPDRPYFIPQKARLIVNGWAIGRDPSVWKDPLAFKPERFMGKDFDVTRDQEMSMIPFGAGRRGCPGASMAIATTKTLLAQLVHCFDWKLEGDPSHLNMDEKFGLSIPRKVHLFALPTLKFDV